MINNFKLDFPLLKNSKTIYLDTAATAQKPACVIKAEEDFYKKYNANTHSSSYTLSDQAQKFYDTARHTVAQFIGCKDDSQIIFTKNTTDSINLVANSFGMQNIKKSDKIVLSIMEHHSNLVPWQMLAKQKNAKLEYMYIDETLNIPTTELDKIDSQTKIVAITMVSNVLGTIVDVKKIIKKAHSVGAIVVVDAAQAIAHLPVNVLDLDADFLAFSGHKMFGPLGIGVLFGKKNLLEKMQPISFGGAMIEFVEEQNTSFADLPNKFEAGTQNVAGAVGLAAAIAYIQSIGYKKIQEIEQNLINFAVNELKKLNYVQLYIPKNAKDRSNTISFNIKNLHSHDVATLLDSKNVCVRSGNHCAQPLLHHLNIPSTCRISFAIYNTLEDVQKLVDAIKTVYEKFKKYIG